MNNPVIFNQKQFSFLQTIAIGSFIVLTLYFGRILFIPLFYGLFIAIVLYPVCRALENMGVPKTAAIAVCLLIVTLLIACLILLLIFEIRAFTSDLPQLQKKITVAVAQLQRWAWQRFGFSISEQGKWMENLSANALKDVTSYLSGTLTATINTLFIAFMVPVFTALFLYNRNTFVHFLRLLVGLKYKEKLDKILRTTIHTYHKYVKGMILVYLVVGVLNSIGLLILGVRHAILFGMLTAVMTIIPYIGIIVSALLPISIAWISTGSIWMALGVIAVFSVVQYLEANIIFPFIVGAQLNVNTWATLVAVIAGGIVWGVSGMILFMPFVAILKIVTDSIEDWKALNVLLSRSK